MLTECKTTKTFFGKKVSFRSCQFNPARRLRDKTWCDGLFSHQHRRRRDATSARWRASFLWLSKAKVLHCLYIYLLQQGLHCLYICFSYLFPLEKWNIIYTFLFHLPLKHIYRQVRLVDNCECPPGCSSSIIHSQQDGLVGIYVWSTKSLACPVLRSIAEVYFPLPHMPDKWMQKEGNNVRVLPQKTAPTKGWQ
jgi:hypothetical protein